MTTPEDLIARLRQRTVACGSDAHLPCTECDLDTEAADALEAAQAELAAARHRVTERHRQAWAHVDKLNALAAEWEQTVSSDIAPEALSDD